MLAIREQGFIFESSELLPGVSSIALPIVTKRGTVVASLGIGAIEPRLTPARVPEILALLRDEVSCIQTGLAESRALIAHE